MNGFGVELSLHASRHGQWFELPLTKTDRGFVGESGEHHVVEAVELIL